MKTTAENRAWARAFARQAISDLQAREVLVKGHAERCHQLHFLQMSTEKLCKAYMYAAGNIVQPSHAVLQKQLPTIARVFGAKAFSGQRMKRLKQLAYEMEMLAPALRADGSRPDNTEYPCELPDGQIVAPVDYAFAEIPDQDLPILIKVLKAAATAYLPVAEYN